MKATVEINANPANRIFWMSAAAFIVVSAVAGARLSYGLDLWSIETAQTRTFAALDGFGNFVSLIGDVEYVSVVFVVMCAVLYFMERKVLAIRLVVAYAVCGLIEFVMKFVLPVPPLPDEIGRNPNYVPILDVGYLYPYPSGHMLRSVLLLGIVYVLWPNKIIRAAILVFLAVVFATRIYLGVHWPSDLIGGALLGLAGLAWAMKSKNAWRKPA